MSLRTILVSNTCHKNSKKLYSRINGIFKKFSGINSLCLRKFEVLRKRDVQQFHYVGVLQSEMAFYFSLDKFSFEYLFTHFLHSNFFPFECSCENTAKGSLAKEFSEINFHCKKINNQEISIDYVHKEIIELHHSESSTSLKALRNANMHSIEEIIGWIIIHPIEFL